MEFAPYLKALGLKPSGKTGFFQLRLIQKLRKDLLQYRNYNDVPANLIEMCRGMFGTTFDRAVDMFLKGRSHYYHLKTTIDIGIYQVIYNKTACFVLPVNGWCTCDDYRLKVSKDRQSCCVHQIVCLLADVFWTARYFPVDEHEYMTLMDVAKGASREYVLKNRKQNRSRSPKPVANPDQEMEFINVEDD